MYADRRLSQSGEICQPLLRKASLFKKAREDLVIGLLPDEREKDFFRGVNSRGKRFVNSRYHRRYRSPLPLPVWLHGIESS